jgi:protein ImuB
VAEKIPATKAHKEFFASLASTKAFSSEVGTGSREENASKQNLEPWF